MSFNDPYSSKLLRGGNAPTDKQVMNNNSITFIGMGRVLKTILGDNEDDKDFNDHGLWKSVGAIKYELVYDNKLWDLLSADVKTLVRNKPIAYPFISSITNYPVEQEIVLLFSGPSIELNETKTSKSVYYMGPYALWGNANHNAMPDLVKLQTIVTQDTPKNGTLPVGPNTQTNNFNPPIYGPDFEEKIVPPLRVFNGDIIYSGRFGQSIRFGHTVSNKKFFNTWSNNSTSDNAKDSDPITIISNKIAGNSDIFQPVVEDVNKDESSTWYTSTQRIPFNLKEYKLDSFKNKVNIPTSFDKFSQSQHISVGDRVVIWGKKDYVFLLGKKGVSISSPKTVNIDSPNVVVNAKKIKLGLNDEEIGQAALLGDITVDKLSELLAGLEQFTYVMSLISETGFAQAVVQIKASAELLNNTCKTLKEQVSKTRKDGSVILSKVTFTK